MAAPTLNRARPFGTISGDTLGRCFEQDNLFFMADGSQWEEPAAPAVVAEAPPEAVAAPLPEPAAAAPAPKPVAKPAAKPAAAKGKA